MSVDPADVVIEIERWRATLRAKARNLDAYDPPFIAPAEIFDEAVAAGVIVDGRYRASGPRDAVIDGTRWIRADS